MTRNQPVRAAVLIDLEWRPDSGGHVKCWDRLAEAAVGLDAEIDLTLHFSSPPSQPVPLPRRLGANVRYRFHPPVFSTRRLPFLSAMPDHADLGGFHRGLAESLRGADVIHTTDGFFTFAKTAARVCRRHAVPLVTSIHTDTPAYAGLFTADLVERLFGAGPRSRWLLRQTRIAERVERQFGRALGEHLAACDFALVSRLEDERTARAALPAERIGWLRRGVDRDLFHPNKRDRAWLEETFGVPEGAGVVMFAGRVDRGKNALPLARAVARMIDAGENVFLLCAGEGADRQAVREQLGSHAACPGNLDQRTLARAYASSDVLAAPSTVEIVGNVVMEAAAAGLPALVNGHSAMARLVVPGRTGWIVDGAEEKAWQPALRNALSDRCRLREMARAARRHAKTGLPGWRDVLRDDVLPVWQGIVLAGLTGGGGTRRRAA